MNAIKVHTSTVKHPDKYLKNRKNNFVLYSLCLKKTKHASKTNGATLKQFFYMSSYQLSHWRGKKFQSKFCLNLKPTLKPIEVNVKMPWTSKGHGGPVATCFCSI